MFEAFYSLPFLVLEVPNLKIKQPTWIHQPSAMTMFSIVLLSYFLVTGGKCVTSTLTIDFSHNRSNFSAFQESFTM